MTTKKPHGNRKLSDEQIEEIRKRLKAKEKVAVLAIKYKVSETHICYIRSNKRRKVRK